jgi:hypothetical protein
LSKIKRTSIEHIPNLFRVANELWRTQDSVMSKFDQHEAFILGEIGKGRLKAAICRSLGELAKNPVKATPQALGRWLENRARRIEKRAALIDPVGFALAKAHVKQPDTETTVAPRRLDVRIPRSIRFADDDDKRLIADLLAAGWRYHEIRLRLARIAESLSDFEDGGEHLQEAQRTKEPRRPGSRPSPVAPQPAWAGNSEGAASERTFTAGSALDGTIGPRKRSALSKQLEELHRQVGDTDGGVGILKPKKG